MVEEYLGYAILLTNISFSVILAYYVYKLMNDGESGIIIFRKPVVIMLSFMFMMLIGILGLIIGLGIVYSFGLEERYVDYLAIPISTGIFISMKMGITRVLVVMK